MIERKPVGLIGRLRALLPEGKKERERRERETRTNQTTLMTAYDSLLAEGRGPEVSSGDISVREASLQNPNIHPWEDISWYVMDWDAYREAIDRLVGSGQLIRREVPEIDDGFRTGFYLKLYKRPKPAQTPQ